MEGRYYMDPRWMFLLVIPLFCTGYAAENSANEAPLPDKNPEYSAPAAKTEDTDKKPLSRQVYRRKLPSGIKALSNEPVSTTTVYYPRGEKDPKEKTETSVVTGKDNTDQLPRWRASQPPVRKSLPRVTNFRPASSCSFSSSRCRTTGRKIRYYNNSGVRIYYRNSSCGSSRCGTQIIIR